MPNWCFTNYSITGPDVKKVYNLLKEMEEEPHLKSDFGNMWLGNLLHLQGLNWKEISCRGYIEDYELDGEYLTINTETAWVPMNECIQKAIYDKFDVSIIFTSDEDGLDTHITNDPVYVNTYHMAYDCKKYDHSEYDNYNEYELTEDSVIKILSLVLTRNGISLKDIKDLTNKTEIVNTLINLAESHADDIFHYFECWKYEADYEYFN